MRTYYDPEDDTMTPEDRCERLAELGDYMRERLLDKDGPSPEEIDADAKCDALDAMDFAASSDAAENSPVAMLPAEPSPTLTGELGGEAAGDYTLTDTEDSIRPPTEEEENAYRAAGVYYAQIARALLTRCFKVMSGREINACQIATGDYDTDEGFRAHLIDSLAIQYSREISEHINQNASILP